MKKFIEGMGSIITLFPQDEKTVFSIPSSSDEEAIRNDWQQVGDDLRFVIGTLNNPEQ